MRSSRLLKSCAGLALLLALAPARAQAPQADGVRMDIHVDPPEVTVGQLV